MEDDGVSTPAGIIEGLSIYKLPLLLGAGSVFVVAVSVILLVKSVQNTQPIEFSSADSGLNSQATASGGVGGSALGVTSIMVDVEGAVLHPGLYSLSFGARVEDAILAAGGVAKDVDGVQFAKSINRASKIVDGAKLYVPKIGDNKTSHNENTTQGVGDTSHNLNSAGDTSQNGSLVSINLASESELDSLPGVGPVTAQKIMNNRPYQTLDELVNKKAIGPSLYEKLKNNLSL